MNSLRHRDRVDQGEILGTKKPNSQCGYKSFQESPQRREEDEGATVPVTSDLLDVTVVKVW